MAADRRQPRAPALARAVRADAGDPGVRGARERALHDRHDARARPPLHRRGGGRGRRLRGAAARRLHHQHAPRPRALPGQGRLDRPHVRRAARQARPATAGARAGRCTSPTTQSGNLGANAIVGGSAGIATGAALRRKARESGQVAVCFFGEGALGQGLLYEVDEHGVAVEAAGRLRLREQHLQRVHALLARRRPGERAGPRRGVRHAGANRRRPGRARCLRGGRATLVERARSGEGPASSCARPTASTAITSATSTAPTTARGRGGSVARRARSDRAATATWLLANGPRGRRRRSRRDRGASPQPRWTRAWSSRSPRRIRSRSR